MLNMPWNLFRKSPRLPDCLALSSTTVPVRIVAHPRARRYVLSVRGDGSVRVTMPRRGSRHEAWAFATRQTGWIEQQLAKRGTDVWEHGREIFFRGDRVPLVVTANLVSFRDQQLKLPKAQDVAGAVQRHLWNLARQELPARTMELAARHGLVVQRVTVRNQRSRWGSCSPRGAIALNWRLIQAPAAVSDYVILHELMHLRELNHSPRFWQLVATACPDHRQLRTWLRVNHRLLV